MRTLFILFLVATAGAADGPVPLYTEDFETDPGYVVAAGANANNISSVSFGRGESGFPALVAGQYGGTGQYLSGTAIVGSTANGALQIGSSAKVEGLSRNRSYVTIVDTSEAEVGQYRVTFDVRDFISGDEPNTALYFHIYEGRRAHMGHVKYQLTSQKTLPELASTRPIVSTAQGGMNYEVTMDNEIEGDGKFDLSFGLTSVGEKGDFLALVWSQVKRMGGSPMSSMTVDNISIVQIPEPDPGPQTDVPGSPTGQSGDWKLVGDVSDEFEAATVNPRKWNNSPGSWGAWSWDEKNTYQEDGKLFIQMVHEPHMRNSTRLFYKSGILRSHQQMTYGYYEVRMRGCSLFPGACPAFWIYSDGRQYTGEVRYCEVDFVELQMNELNHDTGERDPVEHIDMNLHLRLADEKGGVKWVRPGTDPELCKNSWMAPWDPRDDFHVYGCDVSPEAIIWYIDGKEVARKPNQYWHLPMNVTLSLGLRHPHIGWVGQDIKPVPQNATADGFPTSMEVDWVRVWERQ